MKTHFIVKEEFDADGWDCDEVRDSGLMDTLRKCCNLEYNLRACNRGASDFGDTLEDLKAYVNELAEELKNSVVGFPGEDIDESAHDLVTIDERLDELDDDGWPKKDFTVGVFKNGELIERFKNFDDAREWGAENYDIGDDDVTIEDLYGDECYADFDPHDPMLN